MGVENFWDYNDFANFRDAYFSQAGYVDRRVLFKRFTGWKTLNAEGPTIEQIKVAEFAQKRTHVYISEVKQFDTDRRGAFVAGDMDCLSTFQIRGRTPGYVTEQGERIDEYAGDEIIWSGKVWRVADQVEPIIAGLMTGTVYYRTVIRRHDLSGPGTSPGIK